MRDVVVTQMVPVDSKTPAQSIEATVPLIDSLSTLASTLREFNPNHDPKGRFASGGGGSIQVAPEHEVGGSSSAPAEGEVYKIG